MCIVRNGAGESRVQIMQGYMSHFKEFGNYVKTEAAEKYYTEE